MGKRKRLMAERLKENKKQTAIAKLNNVPTSPRKMRLVADTVRGVEVNRALDLLKFSKKAPSIRLEKLLKSAIANWEAKNADRSKELDNGNVYVKTIMVDEGKTLKRIRPCPQGRAGRIRKRSNHANPEHNLESSGKAGRSRWLGRRPHNRGVVMNPVDHPMGGGEGRASGGHPRSRKGLPAKGYKTRNPKATSNKFIIERRKK